MKMRRSLVAAAGALFIVTGIFSATPSHADEVDYVSVAIDAMQAGGAAVGIFITEDEKRFLKPLVKCLADNGAQATVQKCGQDVVAGQLPPGAQEFADCVVKNGDLTRCVRETAIKQLPEKARGPAGCVLEGKRLDVCAKGALLNELEQKERDALQCLERTKNLAQCGIDYVRSEADNNFVEAWGKVKGDVGQIGDKAEGPIKNIVDVAVGIRDDDWVKVVMAGGAAATKIAGRIVLKIFLGGVGDILFGPAVDAAVDNRIGMVSGIMRAAKLKDPGAVAEVLIAANLGYAVFVACSVITGEPLPVIRDFQKAVCLSLGAIITEIADVGGSIVNKIADLIHFDEIANKIEKILHDARLGVLILTGEKTGKCKPVKDAYKDIYAKCYSKQAFLNLTNAPNKQSFPQDRHQACRDHYLNCTFANDDVLDQTCRFLTEQYLVDTTILTKSIQPEAEAGVAAKLTSRGCKNMKFDDAERTGLELDCKKHLDTVFPATGSIDTNDCSESKTPSFGDPIYGLYAPVCKEAVNTVEARQTDLCKASLTIPECTGGRFWNITAAACTCRDGFLWDDKAEQCVNTQIIALGNPCQGGMLQDPLTRKCKCASTQLWDGTKCKSDKSIFGVGGPKFPGMASPCTGGMRMGSNGTCECPPATYWSGGQCKPSSAPIQGNAKDKFVFNGGGASSNSGTEVFRRCSGRRPNGIWPNCCPARTHYSNGMCRYTIRAVGKSTDTGPAVVTAPAAPKNACVGRACCPVGTFYRNGVCRRIVVDPKPPQPGRPSTGGSKLSGTGPCPASRPVGRPPYCCPVGTRYTMGACRRGLGGVAGQKTGGGGGGGGCPASRPNGRPPYCCPSGTNYSNGACRRPAAKVPDRRQNYGGAAPACKSYETRGSDGKCYTKNDGVN